MKAWRGRVRSLAHPKSSKTVLASREGRARQGMKSNVETKVRKDLGRIPVIYGVPDSEQTHPR